MNTNLIIITTVNVTMEEMRKLRANGKSSGRVRGNFEFTLFRPFRPGAHFAVVQYVLQHICFCNL